MMKHAVAVREVVLAGGLPFIERAELDVAVGVLTARDIDAPARDVHAGDRRDPEMLEKRTRAPSRAAAVIEDASRTIPLLSQPFGQPLDSSPDELLLRF